MTSYDSSSQAKMGAPPDIPPSEQASADVAPPVGITPPQLLAQDAAAGRRGAAWRLLYWIMENDPRAVIAVSSIEDDRLAQGRQAVCGSPATSFSICQDKAEDALSARVRHGTGTCRTRLIIRHE